jgi:hypothetical protein
MKDCELVLPVSLGEALDKLTILDIKITKISDDRKSDCIKEFEALMISCKKYVDKYGWHYNILREINLSIWELQDGFHGKDVTEIEAGKICSEILLENDRRFRMKAKINHISSSSLREQKGYAKKKCFFYGHLGLGDMFWLCGAVRYLATCYDEVVVVCKTKYLGNVAPIYIDDPVIKVMSIEDDYEIQPFHQKTRPILETSGYTVKTCGYHIPDPRIYEFPLCFYDDLAIPRSVRQTYFYIPESQEANNLLQIIRTRSPRWIIVHQQSQNKKLPIWEHVYAKVGETIPILDLNQNHYPEGHTWWSVGDVVIGKPLFWFRRILEESEEIHLLESSVYCLASHLDLSRVKDKVCYDAFDNSNERIGIFRTDSLCLNTGV